MGPSYLDMVLHVPVYFPPKEQFFKYFLICPNFVPGNMKHSV